MNKFIKVPTFYNVMHRIKNDRHHCIDHQVNDANNTVNLDTIRESICPDKKSQSQTQKEHHFIY